MQWFRFYGDSLNDPKVQSLDGDTFKAWVNILCVASKNDGRLPPISELSFLLRCDDNACLTLVERLLNATLIDRVNGGANGWGYAPHGWDKRQYKSDVSTDRVKRFRNVSVTANETPPDTETETEQKKKEKKEEPPIVPQEFLEFWSIYPKQRAGSKENALKAWLKAIKKSPPKEIIDGTRRYTTSDEVKRRFAKGAAAWLNDDGWRADYSPPINGYSKPEQPKQRTTAQIIEERKLAELGRNNASFN
jgi:hypothetical protein